MGASASGGSVFVSPPPESAKHSNYFYHQVGVECPHYSGCINFLHKIIIHRSHHIPKVWDKKAKSSY